MRPMNWRTMAIYLWSANKFAKKFYWSGVEFSSWSRRGGDFNGNIVKSFFNGKKLEYI